MMHTDIEGYFTLQVRDPETMQIKREIGPFRNLITDYGLNFLGTGGVIQTCAVGSGNAAPAPTDTQLQNRIAYASSASTGADGVPSSAAPWYTSVTSSFRFNQGVAAGNLSEIGIVANSGAPYQLWSRSLILDTNGSPTTITVLANEILDVIYECRLYAIESEASGGPINLLGVDYNWTVRAVAANTDMLSFFLRYGATGASVWSAFNGNLAPVTANNPSGGSVGNSSYGVLAPYVNNSLKRSVSVTWTIAQGNGGGGIKTVRTYLADTAVGMPNFQIGLDKAFPKSASNTLSLSFEYSWSRRTI